MTETRTYLLIHQDGTRRKVTVPDSWKVTFGPLVVPRSTTNLAQKDKIPIALRFYENENKQRAVFTDVVSFRDLSIEVLTEVVEVKSKMGTLNVDGGTKNVHMRAETREWKDDSKDFETPLQIEDRDLEL